MDGVCTSTYGYVKVGGSYYKIEDTGSGSSSNTASTAADCNTLGTLYSDNKLCIITSDTENTVNFASAGTAYYSFVAPASSVFSNTGGNIIVRKIKNAVILENVNCMLKYFIYSINL